MSFSTALNNDKLIGKPVSRRTIADSSRHARTTGLLTRFSRKAFLKRLSRLGGGQIVVHDGSERFEAGAPAADQLRSSMLIHSDRFYHRLACGGSLGFAESYLQGEWDSDDLPTLFRIFCRNLTAMAVLNRGSAVLAKTASLARHCLARNTRRGSRRNIETHYDLGNDFFRLFLDPTMMYSSAVFEHPGMSLAEAQYARLERICHRLALQPSDHLIEIGTGWGGFALHAATHYGCRVTTTTISRNQYEFAVRRVAEAGLDHRVNVLCEDYRDLEGHFDKLVSIEMIEAVGHRFLDEYFRRCAHLLKPGGRMLLQAITMPEQRYERYLKSVDFIQRYIFPGGCLPSIGAMQKAVSCTSQLRLLALEDFAADYARTLREWRRRFLSRLDEVRAQGYSERFIRMWDYYLCYCEGAFDERAVGVVHATWGR